MKRFVSHIRYKADGTKVNPLIHVFFFVTLVFGLGFTIFYNEPSVQQSILFSQTISLFGLGQIKFWGALALFTAVGNWWVHGVRLRKAISPFAILGFLLWAFAFFIYLQSGFWFQLFAGALPNMIFWAWLWLDIKRFERDNPGVRH